MVVSAARGRRRSLHLDLHLELLERDLTLSDASAYNVQFQGVRPIFIDVLSIRRYRAGEYWQGHRQFCEQFLNPLLLRALLGVAHNAWYRGSLEGIPTADLARLLPLGKQLSWNVLSQVVLQAKLERRALARTEQSIAKVRGRGLSKTAFAGLLAQMRRWIARLRPADRGATVWGDYATTPRLRRRGGCRQAALRRRVRRAAPGPRCCSTSAATPASTRRSRSPAGAGRVVGFDFDQQALDRAFMRAEAESLDFLPLFLDALNPSPDQGWRQAERAGFAARARPDALLALAFAHHLAIGRNVPLAQTVAWLTGLAPRGVIEFVPKNDPTVQPHAGAARGHLPRLHRGGVHELPQRRRPDRPLGGGLGPRPPPLLLRAGGLSARARRHGRRCSARDCPTT